jgi:hypothetical protein
MQQNYSRIKIALARHLASKLGLIIAIVLIAIVVTYP